MIRTLLTTTALAALLTTGALAQDAAAPAAEAPATTAQDNMSSDLLNQGYDIIDTDGLASRLLGFPIYSSAAADAEQIGEINDLVIDESGNVAAVLVGVGGFLGVGEKNVAINYTELQWTTAEDNSERLVLEITKEALNAAPGVELQDDAPADTAATQPVAPANDAATGGGDAMDTAVAPVAPATEGDAAMDTAAVPADEGEDAMETGSVATQPMADDATAFDRSTLTELDESTLTAEELIGTDVYGPSDQHVGTIGDFAFADDGKTIDAVIVDVGGFLGIGAKEVAIGFENLNFATDADNNRYLLIDATKEQLEAQAAFNRDTYPTERDSQRLMVEAS